MKTECPLGLGGSQLGMRLAACQSIWSAAIEAQARWWGAGMEGELCGLGKQAVVRMASSGVGASHRVVTPAEGWAGGFVAACSILLNPTVSGQCWGTR